METKSSSHLPDPDDIVIGEDKILPMGCHRTAQLCGNPEDKSQRGSGLTWFSAAQDAMFSYFFYSTIPVFRRN